MKEKRNFLFSKALSFMMAVVMVFSVITVMPGEVKAAELSIPNQGGTVTLTDEACVTAALNGGTVWVRYKAPADGYLQLKFLNSTNLFDFSAGTVRLYDAAKRTPLSQECFYDTSATSAGFNTEYYGVKAKKTYYISVYSNRGVAIKASFKKCNDKKASNKKKAVNIKSGKKGVQGIIAAGTTTTRWYKFTMKKNQKLNVSFTSYLTDDVYVTVSGPGLLTETRTIRSRSQAGTMIYLNFWGRKYPLTTKNKIRSGTYYIKVRPASKVCTGYYKINWK